MWPLVDGVGADPAEEVGMVEFCAGVLGVAMLIAGLLFLPDLLGPPLRAAFRVRDSTRFAAGFVSDFALFFFKALLTFQKWTTIW
jgi:hypothetical protein